MTNIRFSGDFHASRKLAAVAGHGGISHLHIHVNECIFINSGIFNEGEGVKLVVGHFFVVSWALKTQ